MKVIDKTTGKPVPGFLRYGVFPDDNPNTKAVPNLWHNFHWTDTPQLFMPTSEFRIVVFPGKGLMAVKDLWGDEYITGVGVEAFKKYRHEDQLYGLAYIANIHVHEWQVFAEIDVPADAKEFSITLALDRGVTAAGRLVDADGKAVTGAENYGLDSWATGMWMRPRPLRWSYSAPEATFTALALRPEEKRRVMFVHRDRKLAGSAVVVGGAKDPVEVRMEPWGEVTGRIVGVDGKPVTGRVDLLWDSARKPGLDLGSSPFSQPGSAGTSTGPDGRFRIIGLIPGLKYRWSVMGFADGGKSQPTFIPDVTPKSGQTIDLGDVMVREDP